jgi:hypothetical protein
LWIVGNQWADSKTVHDLQTALNFSDTLHKAPPSGLPLFGFIATYLGALSNYQTLQTLLTTNNSYLATALLDVQHPSGSNGGLQITGQQELVPRWEITPLEDILAGLNGGVAATLNVTVAKADGGEYNITLNGGVPFHVAANTFFTLTVGDDPNFFQEQIVASSTEVKMTIQFSGAALVNISPAAFSIPSLYWYWQQPLLGAVKNGHSDVSGYVFTTNPSTDLSAKGPLGYLQTVAISQYPNIVITAQTESYESIAKTLQAVASVKGSFLNTPLYSDDSNYSLSVTTEAAQKTVTVTLVPPAGGLGQSQPDKRAWILGASTFFPGVQQ